MDNCPKLFPLLSAGVGGKACTILEQGGGGGIKRMRGNIGGVKTQLLAHVLNGQPQSTLRLVGIFIYFRPQLSLHLLLYYYSYYF